MPDSESTLAEAASPEARYSSREAVQLAFIAGIQQLPARQRAALLVCDVLGWPAAEAATLLDSSTASVNSALQRARETLSKSYPEGRPSEAPVTSDDQRQLLARYLRAWEGHDLDGFVALLKEDASAVMPPWLEWYAGRPAIRAFFDAAWKTCGGLRLVPMASNGQPGFAVYESMACGGWRSHSLHVLTIEGGADGAVIGKMTLFIEREDSGRAAGATASLFDAFGFPRELPEA